MSEYSDKVRAEIETNVREVVKNPTVENLYNLVLSGHKAYRQGLGLPHEHVLEAIEKGLKPKD